MIHLQLPRNDTPIDFKMSFVIKKALKLKLIRGDTYRYDNSIKDMNFHLHKTRHKMLKVKIGEYFLKVISYNTTIKILFDLSTILKNKSCLVH